MIFACGFDSPAIAASRNVKMRRGRLSPAGWLLIASAGEIFSTSPSTRLDARRVCGACEECWEASGIASRLCTSTVRSRGLV